MKKWNMWMGVVTLVGFCSPWGLRAATNTWDAEIGTAGAQDGSGVWSTQAADSNWWNHASANTNWVNNSTYDDLTVIGAGSGAAGTITLGENITVGHVRLTRRAPAATLLTETATRSASGSTIRCCGSPKTWSPRTGPTAPAAPSIST